MTAAVTSAATAGVMPPGATFPSAQADPLLPEPATSVTASYDDVMSAMYIALSNLRQNSAALAAQNVATNKVVSDHERADHVAALERAEADQADSGSGFFSSLGKLAGDFVDDLSEGHIADAFSDVASDASAAWNSPKFWNDLETGLRDIGASLDAVAAVALVAGPAGAPLAAIASAAGAVAMGGSALAKVRCDTFTADAEDADANATQAQHQVDMIKTTVENVLTDLKESDQSQQNALGTLGQAIATNDQTLVNTASIHVRG